MNKKKLVLCIIVIVMLVISFVLIINYTKKKSNLEGTKIENKTIEDSKLKSYIDSLKDNFYAYYTGEFKDINGTYKKASIYYCKNGKNYAIKSDDLGLHVVLNKNKLYNISHIYKMIIVMNENALDLSSYNLISLDGKQYLNARIEKADGVSYYVEDYKTTNESISYYFIENSLKKIQIQRNEKKQNIVFSVENSIRQDLFIINENYEITYA